MKRLYAIILLVSAILLKPEGSAAQEYKKEISISWSGTPLGDMETLLLHHSGLSLSSDPLKYMFSDYDGPTSMTGNIILEMNFLKRKRWSFSLSVAANGIWKDSHDPLTDAKVGRINGFSATILPQWRLYWKNKDFVKLYSSVGLGLTIGSFDGNAQSYGSFQIGLLGFQIGRRFFVFGEAGCGYLYMGGKAGVGYRF